MKSNHRHTLKYLLVFVFGGLLAWASPGVSAGERPDIAWGANGHPIVSYPDISIESQMVLLRDLGMSWYRVDIGNPSQARRLAAIIEVAKAYQITILPVITPGFPLDKMTSEELFEKARSLAHNLVTRFKGEIKVWELGNELESYAIIQPCEKQDDGVQYNCEWGPAGGVGVNEYYGPRWAKVAAVLRGLSTGAREADPSVRRAIGTAGWGHVGAFERMQRDGVEWDISVWHMYGEDPEWGFKALSKFGKPIWVTEFNSLGGSSKGESAQVDGLRTSMQRLRELREKYNVEAAMLYELLDEPYWAPSVEAQMGLVSVVRSPTGRWRLGPYKEAYAIVKALIGAGAAENRAGIIPPPRDGPCAQLVDKSVELAAGDAASYIYCLALGRTPSQDEALRAGNVLRLTQDPGALILKLLDAPSLGGAPNAAKADDRAYVALTYRWLLGREVDGGGLSAYASDIEQKKVTRAEFVKAIINSAEFRERHAKLYSVIPSTLTDLRCQPPEGRNADAGQGKAAYLVQLVLGKNGSTEDFDFAERAFGSGGDIAGTIIQLIDRIQPPPRIADELSDDQFVTMAYFMLLNRAPDGTGMNDYAGALRNGQLTRGDLVRSLAGSDEFQSRNRCLFD